jgi:hypothetical protein
MEWLFSWEVASWIIAVAITLAFAFVALSDYKLAKLFFIVAASDAIGGIAMWGTKSSLATWQAALSAFAGCGIVGVLLVLSLRYADKKAGRDGQQPVLYAEVLTIAPGPIYQFYQHPPVAFVRLDTMLYVSITNASDIPLYISRYSAAAFLNGNWITFKNPDPGGYQSDEFGAMIPLDKPTTIRRLDLSSNGFDFVMRHRPLAAHENLKLWMFFLSGIEVGTDLKAVKIRLTFYDSTNKKYECMSQNREIGITVGPEGSGTDVLYLPAEPIPPNLHEEGLVK